MANLAESSIWETGVYQIEENDPVHGGANGITNRPTKQLANRTVWLKNELASSVQAINANLTNLSTNKADKTLNLVAGNGLTGGGTLQASRTVALGTPSQITASTTNSVTATSHTHAIDKASTTVAGIVQLADNLTTDDATKALTAKQGKALQDKINSISIGGRNLLRNTANPSYLRWADRGTLNGTRLDVSSITDDVSIGVYTRFANINLDADTDYVLSFDVDTDLAVLDYIYILESSGNIKLVSTTPKIGRTSVKFRTPRALQNVRVLVGAFKGSATYLDVRNLKLETGNVATGWTPAPEDKAESVHRHAWSDIDGVPSSSTTVAGVVQLHDGLDSTAVNLALTANQGKILNDKITATDAKADTKANQATVITAGNGLTGGGTLQASRTVALGTPSQITASTTNSVTATSHTHAIDKASTTVAGIVQLADNLTTDDATKALTAKQGKALQDNKADKRAVKFFRLWVRGGSADVNLDLTKRSSIEAYFGDEWVPGGVMQAVFHNNSGNHVFVGLPLGEQRGQIQLTFYSMGGFSAIECYYMALNRFFRTSVNFNNEELNLYWKEFVNADGNVASATQLQTARTISTTGDATWSVSFDGSTNASGALTLANSGVTAGSYNALTVDSKGRVTRGLTQVHGLITATTATGTANQATTNTNTYLNIVASGVGSAASVGSSTQVTGTNGITVSSDTAGKLIISRDSNSPTATKLQTPRTINGVAFDGTANITITDDTKLASNGNAVSASKLATARTISLTGAVTGSVSFDGSANVNIATTLNLADFANSKTENGYQKLPNGLIIQWGKYPATSYLGERSVSITFPIAFPSQCLNVFTAMHMAQHSPRGDGAALIVSTTPTGATLSLQAYNESVGDLRGFGWLAIGY